MVPADRSGNPRVGRCRGPAFTLTLRRRRDGAPLHVRSRNGGNGVGRGFSPERVLAIKQMHRLLYRQGLTLVAARAAIAQLAAPGDAQQDVARMLDLLDASSRGIAR